MAILSRSYRSLNCHKQPYWARICGSTVLPVTVSYRNSKPKTRQLQNKSGIQRYHRPTNDEYSLKVSSKKTLYPLMFSKEPQQLYPNTLELRVKR
jgi:hypothetical protein